MCLPDLPRSSELFLPDQVPPYQSRGHIISRFQISTSADSWSTPGLSLQVHRRVYSAFSISARYTPSRPCHRHHRGRSDGSWRQRQRVATPPACQPPVPSHPTPQRACGARFGRFGRVRAPPSGCFVPPSAWAFAAGVPGCLPAAHH